MMILPTRYYIGHISLVKSVLYLATEKHGLGTRNILNFGKNVWIGQGLSWIRQERKKISLMNR